MTFAVIGCKPAETGIYPMFAHPKGLKKPGLWVQRIDLWALNGAFAAQARDCRNTLGSPDNRLNVNVGVLAIGQPCSATGQRLTQHALTKVKRRSSKKVYVSLCIVERIKGRMGAAEIFKGL